MSATTYNGWANYQTFNVALWIQNTELLYKVGCESRDYDQFLTIVGFRGQVTPDGVSWTDPELDTDELNEMIAELR